MPSLDSKALFDATQQSGIITGNAWKNRLDEGAHLMTMSTYKSLGGQAMAKKVADFRADFRNMHYVIN